MIKTQIHAEIVGHSLSPQGDELISVLCTFPRIILAEVNTHRMLSKNTSSSRAIPFNKMVEAVQNDPFIPIAWQKHHSGMQGNEYHTGKGNVGDINYKARAERNWLKARDFAVEQAKQLYEDSLVTKQLCNRLLEPFMWTTMLITGSKEGWDNFFNLRCPQYEYINFGEKGYSKSWKDYIEIGKKILDKKDFEKAKCWEADILDKLKLNKGQAEIHMMMLSEKIYDAVNESTPKQLKAGEWHIPFGDNIFAEDYIIKNNYDNIDLWEEEVNKTRVKISTAMAARTSYTVVGDEKEINYSKMIELHDRLITQNPPHSSPLEHCARAMSDEEWQEFYKGRLYRNKMEYYIRNHSNDYVDTEILEPYSELENGWCNNFKGFIPYRYMIDNKTNIE